MDNKYVISEEGMKIIETGITKVKRILEGLPESPIDSEFYMQQYTSIYNICSRSAYYGDKVYDKYKLVFMDYMQNTVLPALRQKHDPNMLLKELVKRWSNHKQMTRWLSRFFSVLDGYYVTRRELPSLHETANMCFRDMVYQEVHDKATVAILTLVRLERDGGQIDQALLKNALDIFKEVGAEQYVNDFETPMLNDTAVYYSGKAASWIQGYSYSEYMLKVKDCLEKEKDRVAHYLHAGIEYKLIERVQHELLTVYKNQLLEKQSSECCALLKVDKPLSQVIRKTFEDLTNRGCVQTVKDVY